MTLPGIVAGTFAGIRHDLFLGFTAIVVTLAIIPILTYLHFSQDLVTEERIMNRNNLGVILLDRKNRPFFTFYQAKPKKEIPLSQIPLPVQQAAIALEDKNFYSHPGFSPPSIIRAFFDNLRSHNLSYGGSTITQQLVKNSLLTPKKNFLRKYQEVVLAQEIERRYSKEKVLEMYLNLVYFGEGAFGIEQAAQTYFDKSAQNLNLAESALLIGLLPAPSKLSPLSGDFDEAKKRQEIVLQKMVDQKYIFIQDKEKAKGQKLVFSLEKDDNNVFAPHFALMVKDELVEKYGEETVARSGFRVRTSLDLDWQVFAEKVVQEQVRKLAPNRVSNGAVVVMDPEAGEVRALVGGKDWYENKFGKVNVVTSPRQPGSSFKPLVYSLAFEKRLITPATILKDAPTTFPNFDDTIYSKYPTKDAALRALAKDPNAYYRPVNYDRKFRGPVTARRALANSLNVPSVEVMKKVGVENAVNFARSAGISTLGNSSNYGLALMLGAAEVNLLDLTNFYAALANQGMMNNPSLILQITSKTGEAVYAYQANPKKLVSPQSAFLTTSILSDNKTRTEVFGNALDISRPAAVKTGTTENFKDAWTIGYTPKVVVGVWVGNPDGTPMDNIAGSLGAAPIWKILIEKFSEGTPPENFTPPDGVIRLAGCSGEYFVKGTEPATENCNPARSSPTPNIIVPPIQTSIEEGREDNEDRGNRGRGNSGRGNSGGSGRRRSDIGADKETVVYIITE